VCCIGSHGGCAQKCRCCVIITIGSQHDDAASRHDSNLVCVCLCVRWCALISFGECVCFECECVCACVCVVLFLFILQPSSDNVGLPLTQLQWKAI